LRLVFYFNQVCGVARSLKCICHHQADNLPTIVNFIIRQGQTRLVNFRGHEIIGGREHLGAFLWVKTAITPGAVSAVLVSMDLIRPLAMLAVTRYP
jgi:hypothetical protein